MASKMLADSLKDLLHHSYALELEDKKLLTLLGQLISINRALLLIKHSFTVKQCGMSSWRNNKSLESHGIVHTGLRIGYDNLTILSEKTT